MRIRAGDLGLLPVVPAKRLVSRVQCHLCIDHPILRMVAGGRSGNLCNGIFCAGQVTWAYYDYVYARGWNNGSFSVLRSTRVAGGCTALLSMIASWGSQPA